MSKGQNYLPYSKECNQGEVDCIRKWPAFDVRVHGARFQEVADEQNGVDHQSPLCGSQLERMAMPLHPYAVRSQNEHGAVQI